MLLIETILLVNYKNNLIGGVGILIAINSYWLNVSHKKKNSWNYRKFLVS